MELFGYYYFYEHGHFLIHFLSANPYDNEQIHHGLQKTIYDFIVEYFGKYSDTHYHKEDNQWYSETKENDNCQPFLYAFVSCELRYLILDSDTHLNISTL